MNLASYVETSSKLSISPELHIYPFVKAELYKI